MPITGNISAAISILCVEDEEAARDILCSSLAMKYPGASLDCAANGAEGLALYEKHLPDIVVTDISMPVMDGLQMATTIKSLNPDVVIIAVTAISDTGYLLKAIEIGIDHYVLKPLDFVKLFAFIDQHTSTIMMKRQLKLQNERISKLSRAVEQSPSSVLITDADGIIEYVNPTFTELTGFKAEEVIGQSSLLLLPGQTATDDSVDLWNRISSTDVWHGELQSRKKNGEIYWESVAISAIHEDGGAITNYVAVKDDISVRKAAEEAIEDLNARLAVRAAELERANQDLDAFNYTVAHDLRSPVTGIAGFCSVILEKYGQTFDENCGKYFRIIHNQTLRMDQLITTLLDFSRFSRQEMKFQKVDLSQIATVISLELQMKNTERKAEFIIADRMNCYGDAGLLQVVLNNLLGNAWKYSMKQEHAIIEFGLGKGDDQLLTCYVRDNGVGFDANLAGNLFDPFQRLHSEEEFAGHGIGLATVQRIIQRHGGSVWAESEAGKGATFYFTLKRAD